MVLNNCVVTGKTIDDVWEQWYRVIENIYATEGDSQSSRDGSVVGEVINAITEIEDPTRCILKSKVRNLPMRYCVGELLWYLSGNPELKAIQLYTNAWDRMSDDGVHVNSNYGTRMKYIMCEESGDVFDQLAMCEKLLRDSPSSRQAVIHIKQARDLVNYPTKDVNCTVCLQFFIREGKLYMTTYMRSNDLWMGFPNDVFQFTCVQIYLAMRLGVTLGTYTHIAGSLHLYERDYNKSIENRKGMEEDAVDKTDNKDS